MWKEVYSGWDVAVEAIRMQKVSGWGFDHSLSPGTFGADK